MKKTGILVILFSVHMFAIALSGCGEGSDSSSGGPAPSNQCYTAGDISGKSAVLNGQGNPFPVDTGLLVLSGDQVVIQPIAIEREVRGPIPSVASRLDNEVCVQSVDVCLGTEPIIQQRCRYSCQFGNRCSAPSIGNGQYCCTQTCENVHTGDRCIAWGKQCMRQQNQWSETTLFAGLDNSREAEDRGPMKSADALLLNLRLLFSTVGPGGNARSVECPLGAFKPTVGAEKFTFQLQDVPSCPAVFADHPETPRTLGLLNQMSEPVSYSEGSLVKSWDGRTLALPTQKVYQPEIDLSTIVCIQAGAGV